MKKFFRGYFTLYLFPGSLSVDSTGFVDDLSGFVAGLAALTGDCSSYTGMGKEVILPLRLGSDCVTFCSEGCASGCVSSCSTGCAEECVIGFAISSADDCIRVSENCSYSFSSRL